MTTNERLIPFLWAMYTPCLQILRCIRSWKNTITVYLHKLRGFYKNTNTTSRGLKLYIYNKLGVLYINYLQKQIEQSTHNNNEKESRP